ncbi:MAG: PD-(D/E)XK nuclease family protein, partial [Actinomycetota bacterium]|nr:PD-(D/E)XK nuclease family protein [Actinomycetota bacterium]
GADAGAGAEDLADALADAVGGIDPTEVVSLAEAVDDPGAAPFSPAARARFGQFSREVRRLRRHVGEPLVDLVRRVVDTIGLGVELASSCSSAAAQARDNVAAFVDVLGTYAGADHEASLPGLLAYLRAEDEYGAGLAVALPSDSDSVKLMTVHKAKGLEWEVVFLPALVADVFPSSRGRSRWPTAAKDLPWPLRGDAATLPVVPEWSARGLDEFVAAARAEEQLEERRLGYVALTRARRRLIASGHWWGRTQQRPRGPSDYLNHLLAEVRAVGAVPLAWAEEPPADAVNPARQQHTALAWPVRLDPDTVARRAAAADLVHAARTRHRHTGHYDSDANLAGLMLEEQARVQEWDAEIEQLLAEARAARAVERPVQLPSTLTATALLRLRTDPEGLARDLARPMPRRPSAAARFGTRFHAWVEAYVGQQPLLDPADIPGAADDGIDSDGELATLCTAFRSGPFADRLPHQVEAPFALVLAGRVVRGRIDAVYADADGYEVVDWKTNVEETADPLQLAIYRLAWAEICGVPPERVRASFYYVRSGAVVRPDVLATRGELEALLTCGDGSARPGGERRGPA